MGMNGQHASWIGWRAVMVAAVVAAGALVAAPLTAGATTSWTLVTSPNPGSEANSLAAVACPSATECWAVGWQSANDQDSQTLIEEWNGTAWSAVTSGNINADGGALQTNVLDAVSCASTTDCWAVGRYIVGAYALPLGEHWDGSSWTASPLAVFTGDPPPAGDYLLEGISCPDAGDCWAVGYWEPDGDAGSMQTLIEQWGGSTWTLDSESSGGIIGYLNGISCTSATGCYAVGAYYETSPQAMLVMSWNGTSWQAVAGIPANEGLGMNELSGISCVTASDCWAVGSYVPTAGGGGSFQDLFLEYAGGSWTASAPNAADDDSPSENSNLLSGVSCTSDTSCWAAGAVTVGEVSETLVDAWDGTSWTLVANTPNGGTDENSELLGVACASTGDCAAVGDYGFEDPTLILMYAGAAAPPATPTAAPVPTSGGGMPTPAGAPASGLVVLAAGLAVLVVATGAALGGRRRSRLR